jgi:hypothetical protein
MAPQQIEKIEFAPGNGMVPGAANPLDVVKGARLTVRDSTRVTKLPKLQKKAPKILKSLDAKLKSAPVAAGDAGRARWRGIVRRRRFLFRENAIRVSLISCPFNDPH